MTCCASGIGLADAEGGGQCSSREIALASTDLGGGLRQTILSVPRMHCAGCISTIEKGLSAVPTVENVRANLTMRRVAISWRGEAGEAPDLVGALTGLGYESHLPGDASEDTEDERIREHLVRALAVAGFSSMNIMLLSVSVWAGADSSTRQGFQLLSAALALPAVAYSGSTFYRSAWHALVHGRMNMDLPISVGVLLSFGLSLYDAATNVAQAYFEASTSLLFVLLAGRLLDHLMRRKANSAVAGLARLMPHGANAMRDDGSIDYVALADVKPGMRLLVASGSRVPTDGFVVEGKSELDSSLITGESAWTPIQTETEVRAGAINRGGPFVMMASVAPSDSILSDMTQMLAAAENGRSRYRRLADKAASLYAPVVHTLSFLAFAGWLLIAGDIHQALTIAIAVLVITCPCALGLAVPMVQVVLARRLFERGVMATDGSAFERLAEVDTVAFDKTGTLTNGRPRLLDPESVRGEDLAIAGSMGRLSTHPLSQVLAAEHAKNCSPLVEFDEVREVAGFGVEATRGSNTYRLGRTDWAASTAPASAPRPFSMVTLSRNGTTLAEFAFSETIRPEAAEAIRALTASGFQVLILSGDSVGAVAAVARALNVETFAAGLLPRDKVTSIETLRAQGRKVLMVGDGINDAPALRAAHVSMAPSTASDIGRSAADFVFLGDSLSAVGESIDAARSATRLVKQNFALAALYNAISLPFALTGLVTPLLAAIAMATSSILVVANALRLGELGKRNASRQRVASSVKPAEVRA